MALTRLKIARMQQGLLQWDLAQRAGMSESRLSKMETGKIRPSDAVLGKLAVVLGIPVEVLQEDVQGNSQIDKRANNGDQGERSLT